MPGPLARADEALALSVVDKPDRKHGRKRRCDLCGLMYPQDELHPEFDETGLRRVGYICDSCY